MPKRTILAPAGSSGIEFRWFSLRAQQFAVNEATEALQRLSVLSKSDTWRLIFYQICRIGRIGGCRAGFRPLKRA